MSLNRFTNNSEILNSKSNLEGIVLRTADINSISQDIAVLSDYVNNNNGRFNELGKDIIHILPVDDKVVEFGDFCGNVGWTTIHHPRRNAFLLTHLRRREQ